MAKGRKKDPSKVGLSAPDVRGQGTTNIETGQTKMDSSRKRNRKKSGIL